MWEGYIENFCILMLCEDEMIIIFFDFYDENSEFLCSVEGEDLVGFEV